MPFHVLDDRPMSEILFSVEHSGSSFDRKVNCCQECERARERESKASKGERELERGGEMSLLEIVNRIVRARARVCVRVEE